MLKTELKIPTSPLLNTDIPVTPRGLLMDIGEKLSSVHPKGLRPAVSFLRNEEKKEITDMLTIFIGGRYLYRLIDIISFEENQQQPITIIVNCLKGEKLTKDIPSSADLELELIDLLNKDIAQTTLYYLIETARKEFPQG